MAKRNIEEIFVHKIPERSKDLNIEKILNDKIPEQSKDVYTKKWDDFVHFIGEKKRPEEKEFLQYFDHLHTVKKLKISSLWSIYSMLNAVHQREFGKKLQVYAGITQLLRNYDTLNKNVDKIHRPKKCYSSKEPKGESEQLIKSIPEQSKDVYDKKWDDFKCFIGEKMKPDEDDYMRYFDYLHTVKKLKASSIWSIYSMLNAVHQREFGAMLQEYANVTELLKTYNLSYTRKSAQVFDRNDLHDYLNLPDSSPFILVRKAIIAICSSGGLRPNDLRAIDLDDIIKINDSYEVHVRKLEDGEKTESFFVVPSFLSLHITNYLDALQYAVGDILSGPLIKGALPCKKTQSTRFSNQPMGKNTLNNIGKDVATKLALAHPETYTGKCFCGELLSESEGATIKKRKSHNSCYKLKVLDKESIDAYLDLPDSSPFVLVRKAIIAISYSTGLRPSELRRLNSDDIVAKNDSYEVHIKRNNLNEEEKSVITIPSYLTTHVTNYLQTLTEAVGDISGPLIKGTPRLKETQISRFINQPMGKNLLNVVGRDVAARLGLDNPDSYAGNCLKMLSESSTRKKRSFKLEVGEKIPKLPKVDRRKGSRTCRYGLDFHEYNDT